MKFKLDENLPRELAEDLPRLLLQAARTAGRVLLALDKGIASLLQHPIHELAGVVLFRPDTAGRRASHPLFVHGSPLFWKWSLPGV
jgi:hypothetical protein